MDGKTVLYIPSEGLKMDADFASKDKELVQRLESKWQAVVDKAKTIDVTFSII